MCQDILILHIFNKSTHTRAHTLPRPHTYNRTQVFLRTANGVVKYCTVASNVPLKKANETKKQETGTERSRPRLSFARNVFVHFYEFAVCYSYNFLDGFTCFLNWFRICFNRGKRREMSVALSPLDGSGQLTAEQNLQMNAGKKFFNAFIDL